MKTFVVDSSVAIKWYFPEIHTEVAGLLLNPTYQLHVTQLFLLEFINVVCKKRRRGEINNNLYIFYIVMVTNALLHQPYQLHVSQR